MTARRTLLTAAALSAIGAIGAVASSTALAHTDDGHTKAAGVAKKEQKDWGIAGEAKNAKRVITVSMLDSMRFSPDTVTAKRGETIRFTLKNAGKIMHEFVIGTAKENDEHAALMVKFPNMEHSEPYMAHVPPGKTGSIIWTFNRPGDFEFACLIAGHYTAGMRGKIKVVA